MERSGVEWSGVEEEEEEEDEKKEEENGRNTEVAAMSMFK